MVPSDPMILSGDGGFGGAIAGFLPVLKADEIQHRKFFLNRGNKSATAGVDPARRCVLPLVFLCLRRARL